MNFTQMSGLTAPTTPRRPAAEPMQFSLAAAVEPKPIRFSASMNLVDTVRSQPVPANGKMVVEGFGVMLPLNDPNLRASAQKSLAELQAVMKEKGINEVVLRVPRGDEQVVTQTDITTRSRSGNAAPPADQGRPTPNPTPTPTPPRNSPVQGGSIAPRNFPVQNGVMAIKLETGDNQLDVLKQAVTQAPKGTRIEIEGMLAPLRPDDLHSGSQNAEKLREIQALVAPKDLTVVLRGTFFPVTVQTITKDEVTTAAAPRPAVDIAPTRHHSWPNAFWTKVPNESSIAKSYEQLLERNPGFSGKTFILDGTFGTRSEPAYFQELVGAKGANGDWARDELKQLTALAQKHDLTIVLPNQFFGKMDKTLAITKDGMVAIPLPSEMPTVR